MKKQSNNPSIRPYINQLYRGNKMLLLIYTITVILEVGLNLYLAWFMQKIFDLIAGVDVGLSLLQLLFLSFGMLGIIMLSSLLTYISMPKFKAKGIAQYKDYVFKKITKKNIAAFSRENSSLYLSGLTNDITEISNGYLSSIFALITCVLLFIGAIIMMIFYSPLLTLVAILSSILPLVASILTGNKVAKASKEVSDLNESYTASIKDVLSGFTVIKSFKAELEMVKIFAKETKRIAQAEAKRNKLKTIVSFLGNTAGIISQMSVFIFAAYLSLNGKGITSGVVAMFIQMMNYILNPIQTIPSCLSELKSAKELVIKMATALDENVYQESNTIHQELTSGIKIEKLSFTYGDGKKALKDIDYHFRLGKKYAIVGASGSGKSTLLNLLMSSYHNYEGQILYDDTELRKINSDELYDMQSIIQQNVFVFNSTIKDNITMFKPFSNDEINNAIELSGLSRFVSEKGMNYLCGENGNSLSGGEKQRVAIARSLLKKSQVLLVDEATSSLDSETSLQVSNSIIDLTDMTVIEIRHDLDASILKRYDGILTLKNGELIEEGTFEELINKKGYFYSLFTVSQ